MAPVPLPLSRPVSVVEPVPPFWTVSALERFNVWMVEEPVTASAVVVAPLAVSPPLKAICVVVALEGNGYAKPPVVQGSGMREPSALTVRHWPAEAERPVTARLVVVA